MKFRNISNFIWRAIFTLAYTLTVLPFTVNFFKSIASPSIKETIMLAIPAIPLVDAQNLALPIFLAALEFAAVGLACSLWQKAASTKKVVILILFLGCQTIPMVSIFYDIRGKDYQTEKKTYDENKKEKVTALAKRITGLNLQISTLSKDMQAMKLGRNHTTRSINQLFDMTKDTPRSVIEDVRAEIREQRSLRIRDEVKMTELLTQKKALETDLKKKEDELQAAQTQMMKDATQIEYIVRDLLSTKSALAGFIVVLFPVTLLSVAFILPKNSMTDAGELPSFNLQEHLLNASSLPKDMHYRYVRLLIPSIDAYISAFKASKTVANENDNLHLQNALIGQLISEVGALQGQIGTSRLEDNSKSYLIAEINKILDKQITIKEGNDV